MAKLREQQRNRAGVSKAGPEGAHLTYLQLFKPVGFSPSDAYVLSHPHSLTVRERRHYHQLLENKPRGASSPAPSSPLGKAQDLPKQEIVLWMTHSNP